MPFPKDPERAELARQRMREGHARRFAKPGAREAWSKQQKEAMNKPGVKERQSAGAYKLYQEHPEVKQKISEATNEAMARPEVFEKMSEHSKRRWQDPEEAKKLIESRPYKDPAHREKISKTTKEAMDRIRVHENPVSRGRWVRAMSNIHKRKGKTTIEIKTENYLTEHNILFQSQVSLGSYFVDIFLEDKNIVIECDGTYWHSIPRTIEIDKRKDEWLSSHGYTVIRLKEADIRKENFSQLDFLLQ